MKAKNIKIHLQKKVQEWIDSIEDSALRERVLEDVIITGGSIASLLLNEKVHDYDVYFRTKETARRVAEYYTRRSDDDRLGVWDDEGRIRITTGQGYSGISGNLELLSTPENIEEDEEQKIDVPSDKEGKYLPLFFSTNAITLSNKIQVIVRFYGEPDEIHENYDFVHCTNYWTAHDNNLVLRPKALESLLNRELLYVGSKYPVCSIIRLRKFIKRGWYVNAGQILKMCMQVSEIDLSDPSVLEDQLTGVDSMYFMQVIEAAKEKYPEKINATYLSEIIDRMFG